MLLGHRVTRLTTSGGAVDGVAGELLAPDQDRETDLGLQRLGSIEKEYRVATDDPRKWEVVTGDGRTVGRVAELLIDPGAMQARYLDVALDEKELELEPVDRHILVPSDRVRLDRKKKKVVLAGLLAPDLADYPQYGGLPFRHRQEKELEEYFRRAGASKREPGARPESGPSDDWRVHTLRTFYGTRPRTRRTTTKEE